ncbi:hypothetical protein D3C80_1569410 [compost metagenome]
MLHEGERPDDDPSTDTIEVIAWCQGECAITLVFLRYGRLDMLYHFPYKRTIANEAPQHADHEVDDGCHYNVFEIDVEVEVRHYHRSDTSQDCHLSTTGMFEENADQQKNDQTIPGYYVTCEKTSKKVEHHCSLEG